MMKTYIIPLTAILITAVNARSEEVQPTGTLPVMYVNVYDEANNYDNEIISPALDHKNFFSGEYWIEADENDAQMAQWALADKDNPLPLEIKGRGNWTLTAYPKKPYKLKLGKKQPLLGMTKSKHFALLPHADDDLGYLRDFTGFNLGKRIGLGWTPSQQPVEVVINGDYRGIYFLTETPRVDEDRVNIAPLADMEETPELISGGYLIEIDNYWAPTNQIRLYEGGLPEGKQRLLFFTFHSPEIYSDIQHRFVQDQFYAINYCVADGSDNIWAYIDLDDMVRYFIVRELMGDSEGFGGSTYLCRDRGEGQKWHFTSLWDFGNAFTSLYDKLLFEDSPYHNVWLPALYKNEKFQDCLHRTWQWFCGTCLDGLEEEMDEYTQKIQVAAIADRARWKGKEFSEDTKIADNTEISFLCKIVKLQLRRKRDWLCTQWGYREDGEFGEPERDDTPAVPLPSYARSAVEDIMQEEIPDFAPIYFDITGCRTANPKSPGTYLRFDGKGWVKVYLR